MQVFISTIVISKETLLFKYAGFTSVFILKDHDDDAENLPPKKRGKFVEDTFRHYTALQKYVYTLELSG